MVSERAGRHAYHQRAHREDPDRTAAPAVLPPARVRYATEHVEEFPEEGVEEFVVGA
jgi:hypothetical protein